MSKFEKLLQVKNEFQGYIENPKLLYTYIAPSNEEDYKHFISIVYGMPTISLYEILNNVEIVKEILLNNFSDTTELELYIASNDISTSIRLVGKLKEYIVNNKINFNY